MRKRKYAQVLMIGAIILAMVLIHCTQSDKDTDTSTIDRRSYVLGGIGAFAEVVDVGVKRLALSAPMSPTDMDALMDEAVRIANENNVNLWRETEFMVTDLFPAAVTEGMDVLFIYNDPVKDEYLQIKKDKAELIQSGHYTGEARKEIARRFGRLLSYPEEKIERMLGN